MNHMNFSVIGGDKRMAMLARLLKRQGGCKHYLYEIEDLPESISADAVVLPVPCSFDGISLNCALSTHLLSGIVTRIKAATVFGGRIPGDIKSCLSANGTKVYDLLEDEALLVKNAQLTAEGALGIIINETKRAVLGSRILILGCGRVGRALVRVLRPLGADVLVAARDPAQLAYSECAGCTPVRLSEVSAFVRNTHVICNTVPAKLLGSECLAALERDTLFIELASGGYNTECVKAAGVRFINAQGLPGKTAPETAALIIYDRMTDLLTRQI